MYDASITTTSVRGTHVGSRNFGTFNGRATTTFPLRSKLAPPPKPLPWFALSAAAAGVLMVVLVCSGALLAGADLTQAPIVGLVLLFMVLIGALVGAIVLTVVLHRAQRAKLPAWQAARTAWARRYYCSRCDVQFTPRATVAGQR
ncbi:hypothetical protein GCM10022255_050110 [Dactylosporangium darangshiense]|uniref:Uncharacterized protein n=1 Tax=Dactylosporangium darangshiense TaxID=579108 RepID=A0ABP8DCX5_9ACTN